MELDDTMFVANIAIVDGIAVTIQKMMFPIDNPLQGIAKVMVHIVKTDCLYQLRNMCIGIDSFDIKHVLTPAYHFLLSLADIEQRQLIMLIIKSRTERSHIRMVIYIVAAQEEGIAKLRHTSTIKAIDGGNTFILTTNQIVAPYIHPLITF